MRSIIIILIVAFLINVPDIANSKSNEKRNLKAKSDTIVKNLQEYAFNLTQVSKELSLVTIDRNKIIEKTTLGLAEQIIARCYLISMYESIIIEKTINWNKNDIKRLQMSHYFIMVLNTDLRTLKSGIKSYKALKLINRALDSVTMAEMTFRESIPLFDSDN